MGEGEKLKRVALRDYPVNKIYLIKTLLKIQITYGF